MGLNIIWLRSLIFGVGCLLLLLLMKPVTPPKYIFINETAEHRFDESIRISIIAAMDRTGIQNAVVITDKFDLDDIKNSAATLFSRLRVGEHQHGRGILYLYSPSKKSLKIEVGYSLESVLPDATVRGLELAAKTFIYSDRYQDFWAELVNTLNIEVYEKEHGFNEDQASHFDFSKFRFLSGGAGITSRSYSPSVSQLKSEQITSAESKLFAASENVSNSVETYLASLRMGVGESKLDILSPESWVFRGNTPLTTYQLFRNWRMYSKTGVDRMFVENMYAFVFFKAGHPTLPIVLKRHQGKWRVQEALSWSLFHRFENSMNVYLKFPIQGISSELSNYLKDHVGEPLYPLEKPLKLVTLENYQSNDSDWHSLYFQLFWLSKVDQKIEDVSKLQNDDIWIAIDTYMNLGKMVESSRCYDLLAARMPQNQKIQSNAKFYRELVHFKDAEWRLNF